MAPNKYFPYLTFLSWKQRKRRLVSGEEGRGRIHHKGTNFRKVKINVSCVKWKRIKEIVKGMHIEVSVCVCGGGWGGTELKYWALVLSTKSDFSPDQCGSVGWASSHKVKGHRSDSPSGHRPGLQAGPQSGCMWEATNQCFSPSLSPTHPLSLKINK